MIQMHTMILWAEPSDEDYDTIIRRAFDTMQALKEFGTEISPNYLTVKRKKDAKPFEWSYKAFEQAIKNGINKEGDNVFLDLGYSISFFSSCVEKDSAGISMTIGVTNSKFKNTLVVNLPQSLTLFNNPIVTDKLVRTFKKCATIFKPFWGCIENETNSSRFDGFFNDNLPTTTHWVNYLGKDIVNRLGTEKFDSDKFSLIEKNEDGYFLKLKETPIDDECVDDILLQNRVNKYFGL